MIGEKIIFHKNAGNGESLRVNCWLRDGGVRIEYGLLQDGQYQAIPKTRNYEALREAQGVVFECLDQKGFRIPDEPSRVHAWREIPYDDFFELKDTTNDQLRNVLNEVKEAVERHDAVVFRKHLENGETLEIFCKLQNDQTQVSLRLFQRGARIDHADSGDPEALRAACADVYKTLAGKGFKLVPGKEVSETEFMLYRPEAKADNVLRELLRSALALGGYEAVPTPVADTNIVSRAEATGMSLGFGIKPQQNK